MKIDIDVFDEKKRAINDLMLIYYSNTYINIKGYLQKLVDLLFKLGYYENNETLFPKGL